MSEYFTSESSASLDGPDWLKKSRAVASELIETTPRPSTDKELWRYSRVGEIDLDAYRPAIGGTAELDAATTDLLSSIGPTSATVVSIDGVVVRIDRTGVVGLDAPAPADFDAPVDIFGVLNAGFTTAPVVVDIPRGAVVEDPVVVINHFTQSGTANFPRVFVRAGQASQASVIEIFTSTSTRAFVSSVVQHDVHQAANLDYVNVQMLGTDVHQVGYNVSHVAQDAHFASTTIALGGDYARVRTDSFVTGKGGEAKLRAVFFGAGSQMHDFRTLQHHSGPKTTSDLFFKGAVADSARSVYSGLIRVEKGAAGTNAYQTNRNLVLSEGAQAESVPNLEIEENDVRCSHASATGPIDEEHRYYLESRGVPTDAANRLIAKGFLDEVLDGVSRVGLRKQLTRCLDDKLDAIRQVLVS